jgi:beta-glucosidase
MVRVTVRNSGPVSGKEIVQLYVRPLAPGLKRPIRELKAFGKLDLQPGEAKTLSFTLDRRAFQMWNLDMKRVVEPGQFEIMAGASSVDLKSATLTVVQ